MADIAGMNFDTAAMASSAVTIGYVIGIIIALAIFAYFIMYVMRYNLKVMVFERRGNNTIKITERKARIFKDGEVNKGELMKWFAKGITFKPHEDNSTVYSKGKSDFIMLYKDAESDYKPIKFINTDPTFITVPQDVLFWHQNATKENATKYAGGGFWEKYGAMIGLFMCLAIIFVMVLVIFGKMDTLATAFQNAANTLAASGKQNLPVPGQ